MQKEAHQIIQTRGKDMREASDTAASADERTVRRAMRGSVEAYGILIEEQKEYLYRTAYLYAGNARSTVSWTISSAASSFPAYRYAVR